MALSRPLFVGFSSASKVAREGGDLEVSVLVGRTRGGRRRVFRLPWFVVRQIDALLERWRREEHEATLLTMNDGELGATLVEAAAVGGLRDVTFLLARGADIDYEHEAEDEISQTALWYSASNGHAEVVAVLLDAGADGWQDGVVMEIAAMGGHTPVVALLIDRGADLHDDNEHALLIAAWHGGLETVRYLLDHGADIHAQNDLALQWARNGGQWIHGGNEAVIALLLERGAVDIPEDDEE